MNVRIGITGTRHGVTDAQKLTVTELVDKLQPEPSIDSNDLHHGACIGADEWFVVEFRPRFLNITAHPSNLKRWWSTPALNCSTDFCIEKDPLDRNEDIVDATDILIAMPSGLERRRSGTWTTVRYARKQRGKQIYIVYPDGRVGK